MIKRFLFLIIFCNINHLASATPEGVEVDTIVKTSVQQSVQKLGNEVLKSNFSYAVTKMYPRWKNRQAKRLGSEKKLLESFHNAGDQLQEAGITVDTFKAEAPTVFYRVHPILKDELRKKGQLQAHKTSDVEWETLALVPTKLKMSFMLEGQPKVSYLRESFQVAICKEGTNEWSFIDGATLRVSDLRSMFPLLPRTLKLPRKVDTKL